MAQQTGQYSDFIKVQIKRLNHLINSDPPNADEYRKEIKNLQAQATPEPTPKSQKEKEAWDAQQEEKAKEKEEKRNN